MDGDHYVYTLESLSNPNRICTGQTQDLKQRLKEHNSGSVPHTSKFTPWHIRSATAFKTRERALAFERYPSFMPAFIGLKKHALVNEQPCRETAIHRVPSGRCQMRWPSLYTSRTR